jgi:hypothetical protein
MAAEHFDGAAGLVWRDARALHGALQGFAALDLDRDVLGSREPGLGLGLSEGGVLQGCDGGRVQLRLGRSPVRDGELPDHGDGQHGACGRQDAAGGWKHPLLRFDILHNAPTLPATWLRHRTAQPGFFRVWGGTKAVGWTKTRAAYLPQH